MDICRETPKVRGPDKALEEVVVKQLIASLTDKRCQSSNQRPGLLLDKAGVIGRTSKSVPLETVSRLTNRMQENSRCTALIRSLM